ncbi:hypothetical protein [Phenylobacterium deserti]|nr:hypothetical protein [Phenylobacterium deserti]
METNDSALNPEEMARARKLLRSKPKVERMWPVVAAAGFAAFCALAFATAMIMAPPVITEHVVESAPK